MNYKIRDGIILKNICDEWLLIAVGDAGEFCEYVRHINDTFAWYWKEIENCVPVEQIIIDASEEFDVSEDIIKKDINDLIRQLIDMNYLIMED